MSAPKKCDDCGTEHHPWQAHVFAKTVAKPRPSREPPVAQQKASSSRASSGGVEHDLDRAASARGCEVCGTSIEGKRKQARTCGPKCRQIASRKRRAK